MRPARLTCRAPFSSAEHFRELPDAGFGGVGCFGAVAGEHCAQESRHNPRRLSLPLRRSLDERTRERDGVVGFDVYVERVGTTDMPYTWPSKLEGVTEPRRCNPTGHANDGSSRYAGFSRVSRLLSLQTLHHQFEQTRERAGPGRRWPSGCARPGHTRREDVFAAQGHGSAGEGDLVQQAIVIDLAQAGPAVLVRRQGKSRDDP